MLAMNPVFVPVKGAFFAVSVGAIARNFCSEAGLFLQRSAQSSRADH
jgi:hypothetical protein